MTAPSPWDLPALSVCVCAHLLASPVRVCGAVSSPVMCPTQDFLKTPESERQVWLTAVQTPFRPQPAQLDGCVHQQKTLSDYIHSSSGTLSFLQL